MKVLVTGGTGFMGSALVRALLAQGHTVAFTTRYKDPKQHHRVQDLWDDCEVLEMDLRHRDLVMRTIQGWGPDLVYHCGAYHHVGLSFTQVEECFDVNAKGSANVIDASIDAHTVYISTSEVYGRQSEVPWVEHMTPNPQSPYGVTKYAGELYARIKQEQGHRIGIVRPFNVFGPGQSNRAVIGKITQEALNNAEIHTTRGRQTREFNYIKNIVEGLIMIGDKGWVGGPLNLCSGEDISIMNLIDLIISESGSSSIVHADVPYRPNEIWEMRGTAVNAKKLLGWTPSYSFLEGIRETIAWQREQLV